ncbi:UNVERIFIED_CONTAM: Cuticle protein 14 isoform b [Trichonephila clavipes]
MHRTKDIHPVVRRILFPVTLPPFCCCRSRKPQNNMEVQFFLFCIAAAIVVASAQEMTIPVGVDGKDTLTTIRNVDADGNYDVGYNENQLTGGASFYRERGFTNGTRTGSYGYTTRNGLIRIVTYVADEDGYRAELLTNEPGVSSAQPANVTVTKEVEPDPVALALGPTGVPLQQSASSSVAYVSEGDPGRTLVLGPTGVPLQQSASSSGAYMSESDPVRNYVMASVSENPGYDGGSLGSAHVRMNSPFAQYEYVI